MELALPEPRASSPRGGSQERGHAHRAAVRGVQGGGGVCGGLGHEHQVKVWGVGGIEEDLPQHGAPRAQQQRRTAAENRHMERITQLTEPRFDRAEQSMFD